MRLSHNHIALSVVLFLCAPFFAHAAVRTLTLGMSGSDVTAMQKELITGGYLAAGNTTGYFGGLTLIAVEKFQCAQNIVCTGNSSYGVVGPHTQAALAEVGPVQPSSVNVVDLTPAATGKFEVSGWIPDWRAASGTADVLPHLAEMTSVMPFGYSVNSSGQVVDTHGLGSAPWPQFIAAAHAARTRVVPTVAWGNGVQEQAILSNGTTRIALENQIAQLVKQNGFDGIDIDFEGKEAETINYFSTFLKGLYERMGNKWVYCTAEARMPLDDRYAPGASIPTDATDYANDYSALNQYCDRVELMAYDQETVDVRLDAARAAPYAPVSDPGWVEDIVDLAAESISRNKLIVGIPDYGYEYQVTPQGGGAYKYNVLWAFNPPYALGIAAQLGITPARNSADEIGFAYNPESSLAVGPGFAALTAPQDGNATQLQQQTATTTTVQNQGTQVTTAEPFNYMTWSDAQAISDKVKLAQSLGVRGVAVFSLGGAEDQNMWNVLPSAAR